MEGAAGGELAVVVQGKALRGDRVSGLAVSTVPLGEQPSSLRRPTCQQQVTVIRCLLSLTPQLSDAQSKVVPPPRGRPRSCPRVRISVQITFEALGPAAWPLPWRDGPLQGLVHLGGRGKEEHPGSSLPSVTNDVHVPPRGNDASYVISFLIPSVARRSLGPSASQTRPGPDGQRPSG